MRALISVEAHKSRSLNSRVKSRVLCCFRAVFSGAVVVRCCPCSLKTCLLRVRVKTDGTRDVPVVIESSGRKLEVRQVGMIT